MNTEAGTVVGEAEGEARKLSEFERWLGTTGSPKSRIDRLEITDRGNGLAIQDKGFTVRK
jgi:hypothetical protein